MTMIEYIINHPTGSIIFFTEDMIYSKKNALSIVKSLCIEGLTTYDGYIKAVKKKFNYSYRIPVYLSEELCLFQTQRVRDYENIWINYIAIKDMINLKDKTELHFKSGKKLIINIRLNQIHEQIRRIHDIKNSKVNIFIFNLIEKVYK